MRQYFITSFFLFVMIFSKIITLNICFKYNAESSKNCIAFCLDINEDNDTNNDNESDNDEMSKKIFTENTHHIEYILPHILQKLQIKNRFCNTDFFYKNPTLSIHLLPPSAI